MPSGRPPGLARAARPGTRVSASVVGVVVRYLPVSADAYAGRPVLRFFRRRQAPFVVDAPGAVVRVGNEYHEPSYRLVPWEMIREVVVGPGDGAIDRVGLRLRADPAAIAHHVDVGGWGYRRIPLELAVGRFSGYRVSVVGEPPATPPARRRPPSPVGPVFAWWYLQDPRTRRTLPQRRLALRIDARGIRLGPGIGSDPPVCFFAWPEVARVVIFAAPGHRDARGAIGVATRPTVPGGGEPRIAAYRVIVGWRLDGLLDGRLEDAVHLHAAHVPVERIGRVPRRLLPN
jgi:hypothetical protein